MSAPRFIVLLALFAGTGCGDETPQGTTETGATASGSDTGTSDADTGASSGGSEAATTAIDTSASTEVTSNDASTSEGSTTDASTTTGDAPPTYEPLVVLDFEEGENGQDAGWSATTGGPVVFDTAQAHSGGTAARVTLQHEQNGFGGYQNLPDSIGPGETVWFRVYLYMPSTLSLSHGDVSGDGFGWNKFLVLSQLEHDSPRMYVQPRSAYQVDFGEPGFADPGLYVNHDGLGEYCTIQEDSYAFPRDQWFALQMAWHVATDGSAWVRLWSDDVFLGECTGGGAVPEGYAVQSWGIGDYWNGGAWIQNGSTGDFWVDDVVVSKATPTTTDDGGRPFISPDHFW